VVPGPARAAALSARTGRVLLVDVADTLLQLSEPPARCYQRFAATWGLQLSLERVESGLRASLAQRIAPSGPPVHSIAQRELESWRAVVASALGEPAAHGPCFEALHAHYARAEAWTLVAGARGALARARELGVALAVVSNMDSRLPEVLREHGLGALFSHVAIPSTCGFAKPSPEIFHAALSALRAEPERALYIGDREAHCVDAARRAGLRALRLVPPDHPPGPGLLCGWRQLEAALQSPAAP